MKKITFILLSIFAFTTIHAQQQRLQKGDVFEYRKSKHSLNNEKLYQFEGMDRSSITFKVLDVTNTGYSIESHLTEIDSYFRNQNKQNNQWESGTYYYSDLASVKKKKNISGSFSVADLDTIRFKLSLNGEISDIEIIDPLTKEFPKNLEIYKISFQYIFKPFIVPLPQQIKLNEEITFNNATYSIAELNSNYITLTSKQSELKVNPKNGVILERQSHVITKDQVKDKTETERTVLIVNNQTPYNCRYSKNGISKDTTLINTNVTIRGKIKNPVLNERVYIEWHEDKANGFDEYTISSTLKKDSTFEIRLHIDDIRKIDLVHKEFATFQILPGDDIYLTVDLNHFDETISATGIGSNHANYFFNRFIFLEKENLFVNDIYANPWKHVDYTYKTYYNKVYDFINRRTAFVNQYKTTIAPEIYLSDYYETVMSAVEKLVMFKQNRNYYAKQFGASPTDTITEEYLSYEDLIHVDNDLMSFSPSYDRFIRFYAFFYIDEKIKKITGTGNTIEPEIGNYLDFLYEARYNSCHKIYKGKTKYILKYETVEDAMERGSREVYTKLFHRFINEYPLSSKISKLKEAFEKISNADIGALAYDFQLEDIQGNSVKLSDFKGKAVYIAFLNPRAGGYLKTIVENKNDTIQSIYKDKDVAFVFIAINNFSDQSIEAMNKLNFKGTKLLATDEETHLLKDKFFFSAFPHHIIIDVDGRIVNRDAPTISELVRQPNLLLDALESKYTSKTPEKTIRNLRIILIALGILIFMGLLSWFIYRRRAAQKIKAAALNTKVRELELTAIRAQMNPHFMYNCLNSIQNLVQKKQNDEAHQYLSKFASLIRGVLKNSEKEEISLAEELELIQQYVELEQLRFDILFELKVDKAIDMYAVFVPPLILQPFVENAVLHGLSPKKDQRILNIEVNQPQNNLCISISDNGIGREQSKANPKSNGKGIGFSEERLNLLAEKYGTAYQLDIEDVKDQNGHAAGTKVQICFPEE